MINEEVKKIYCLLHLPVGTPGTIGQFCGPCLTVRPAKLQLVSFPAFPINLRDIISTLLTLFSWSVL